MTETPVIEALDFSGIFARERALYPSTSAFNVHNFRDLEGTMCFCEEGSAAVIRERIGGIPAERKIHWIDTGDYHYLSYFFLERIDRPFTLMLIDNHPDDQADAFGGEMLSCGGWVRTARERLPLMKEVVWRDSFASLGMTEKALGMTEKARDVYVSIDIDALSREYARTDWSQGEMTLPQLLVMLDGLRGLNILGVDLCGGLTESKGGQPGDFAVNARTKAALLEFLLTLQSQNEDIYGK